MSHVRLKTTYNISDLYGNVEQRTLYAHHNNSCDIVTFYDEDGGVLFYVEDTMNNNMIDAINRLFNYSDPKTGLKEGVDYMNAEDRKKCGIK